MGRGQIFVGPLVEAVYGEFGGGALAVVARHHDDVAQLFRIGRVHSGHEGTERILAGFAPALIDVMDDIIGEAGQHRLEIMSIEGIIISGDEGGRGCAAGRHDAGFPLK